MTEIVISLQAQLIEARDLEQHLRTRCSILGQLVLNHDVTVRELNARFDASDTELKARIAGLEDELRKARQPLPARKKVTDAE